VCGICGILSIAETKVGVDAALINRMTDSLRHRGPDDRGTWCAPGVALGSRRLSVIDLSPAGHMPMSNEDGSVHLVYNGEVYNFAELKRTYDLIGRGHSFRSRTDTEVLLHLYEEIGVEMFRELNGMFAIAIWDARRDRLVLGRDRYGIKPLFYHQDDRWLRFGSEIKAILADPGVTRRPSVQALYDFLTFDYIPGVQTAFEGILEVPPAHYMTIGTDGRRELTRYWDLRFQVDPDMSEGEAIGGARELLERSVRRRLIADVPIGVLLSGGMDSSTILALMHRETSEPIRTYSVGFEDQSFNELPYARTVAQQYGAIQREVVITPDIVRELLPTCIGFIDEPYADGSAIPTYCVCELARDEVVVVLSGEGGDETFAGYETYAAYQYARWFRRVPGWIRNGLIRPAVEALPVSHKKLSLEFKMKRFIAGQDLSPIQAHLWWRVVLQDREKLGVLSDRAIRDNDLLPSIRHFQRVFDGSAAADTLNRLMHVDSAVFLPDDLMIKNDRMSMAHSLEARVPMTDHELTGFMATVPMNIKMKRRRKKHVMRRAMEADLPRSILDKKKVGLEMPYSRWFRHELRSLLDHHLEPGRIAETGLMRPEAVSTLVDEHQAGRRDNGRALWGLLNYMVWCEQYL
jgi:asparagine synthase (glutamine-hydrolysing)